MADIQGTIGSITDSLTGGTFAIVLWVFIGTIVVGIVGSMFYYFFIHRKKFDIVVKIISKRSGENKIYFDTAAILRDKKNNTDYLKLFNSKIELELPKFNIMYHTNKGDYVELLRESERGFRFLAPPRVDSKYIIKQNGKLFPIAKMKHYQIENDLTWILERQKVNKKIISPESLLLKLLDNAPHIIAMAFSFFMLWILFRYAPGLLAEITEIARVLKEKEATEVIGSLIPLGLLSWKKW